MVPYDTEDGTSWNIKALRIRSCNLDSFSLKIPLSDEIQLLLVRLVAINPH